jgi:hypothetical protein
VQKHPVISQAREAARSLKANNRAESTPPMGQTEAAKAVGIAGFPKLVQDTVNEETATKRFFGFS